MRVNESRFLDLVANAEKSYGGNVIDQLALDLRDEREARKILKDLYDESLKEIERLKGLSESQSEALDMMDRGIL